MLRLEGFGKTYHGRRGPVEAVRDFSLCVLPGEFVAIRGPSGCGKSTILLTAGGLLEPTTGRVTIDGADLYAMSPEGRARFRARTIGFVFQQFHLVPYLSVMENVLAPAVATDVPDAPARARQLLERFGMLHRARHVPAELSTGERQRCALARALLARPRLLLADEPTGNLDEANGAAVLQRLVEFAAAGGAVLLVTHDARAAGCAQRVITLEQP